MLLNSLHLLYRLILLLQFEVLNLDIGRRLHVVIRLEMFIFLLLLFHCFLFLI